MTFIRRRWRLILLVIVSALALGLLVAARTPQGTALVNIVDYRLRLVWWSLTGGPTYDPSRTGSLAGTVRDAAGAPLADAVALVSSVRGEVYQARTDDEGRFRIDGVPAGTYVPLAAAWGYQAVNGPEVRVSAGRELRFADFSLPPYVSTPVEPQNIQVGPPQQSSSQFPTPMVVTRIPFTFTLDGVEVNGGQVYLPAGTEPPRFVLFIVYPSAPLNWDAASVALTRDGDAIVAIGPDGDRGLDMDGHTRDMRAAFQLWHTGQLDTDQANLSQLAADQRWVLMSGSFGSFILFRALRDLPPVPAIVNVGGVSDAFLGIQSLYSTELKIPPPYDNAVAALGRPDRDPAFFFDFSPIFYVTHLPPMFVVHSYGDEVIPYNQSEALDATLTAADMPHEVFLYEDTTHYLDAYNPTPATFEVFERTLAFVKQHLPPEP